jgi:hypothetical protein
VGFTHDLKRRLQEHNNNEKDAKRREEYLKTTKGRTTLMTMLQEYFK